MPGVENNSGLGVGQTTINNEEGTRSEHIDQFQNNQQIIVHSQTTRFRRVIHKPKNYDDFCLED